MIRTKNERKWQLLAAFSIIINGLFVVGKYPLVINFTFLIFVGLIVIAWLISQALRQKSDEGRDFKIKKLIQKRVQESDNVWIDIGHCQKFPLDFVGNLSIYNFWQQTYCVIWLNENRKILGYVNMPLKVLLDVFQKLKITDALIANQAAGLPAIQEKLREAGVTVT